MSPESAVCLAVSPSVSELCFMRGCTTQLGHLAVYCSLLALVSGLGSCEQLGDGQTGGRWQLSLGMVVQELRWGCGELSTHASRCEAILLEPCDLIEANPSPLKYSCFASWVQACGWARFHVSPADSREWCCLCLFSFIRSFRTFPQHGPTILHFQQHHL